MRHRVRKPTEKELERWKVDDYIGLRDQFALYAVVSILARPVPGSAEDIAREAYKVAEALSKEKERMDEQLLKSVPTEEEDQKPEIVH